MLEDLLYKTHRDSKVERYAKDALSGIARRRNVLQGSGRERVLQAFGRIMDLKLSYEEKKDRYFKSISAVKTSEGLADLLENLLDSETMEKVAKSKAVVEYDDGRMALVWIPDFETANKVGSHDWCISRSDGGKSYWDNYAEGLNKCYMIVDRALPVSHGRHKFAFHIGPDGDVTASNDQSNGPIDAKTDKDFQQTMETTGARPYNRDDVLKCGDDSLMVKFIAHHGDIALLSKMVLTASNPANELGRLNRAMTACAKINLPGMRRLLLKIARQCAEKGTEAVINDAFLHSICEGNFLVPDNISSEIVGMMSSIAMAQKYCTAEVIELARTIWLQGVLLPDKVAILQHAIEFGNRTMVVSLINSSWADPSKLGELRNFPNILSLGAKINRLLLDSGFQPNYDEESFASSFLFPSSQEQSESAKVYFSDPQIQRSPKFARSLRLELESVYKMMHTEQFIDRDMHSLVLEHTPWVLKLLKRVLSENSEKYAYHIGCMVSLAAGYRSAETAVARYPQQTNLLLDEVDRVKKHSSKEDIALLGRLLGDIKPYYSISSFNIKFAQQALSKESRETLVRLLETMHDFGAEVSQVYMSLLAREGDFDRITRSCFQGEKFISVSPESFLNTALGRPDVQNGCISDQWLTDAETWLQGSQSWVYGKDRDIIGRLFKVLRGRPVTENRLSCLKHMAISRSFGVSAPMNLQLSDTEKVHFWHEAFDDADIFAEFLQAAQELQMWVRPACLGSFLINASKSVQEWAFSVGWDDIMSVSGDKDEDSKIFIEDLIGVGFFDSDTLDEDKDEDSNIFIEDLMGVGFFDSDTLDEDKDEDSKIFIEDLIGVGFFDSDTLDEDNELDLSPLVIGLVNTENNALVSLAKSLARTVPDFNSSAFANAVNKFHGRFSSGDILPLKDSNASEPSFV